EVGSSVAPQVLYTSGILGAPAWARDGSALYVVSLVGETAHLARVPVDGSAAEVLVDGADVFPFRPSLKADGGLVYTADGAVRVLDANGQDDGQIQFQADVILDRTPYTRRSYKLADTSPQKALVLLTRCCLPTAARLFMRLSVICGT